MPVIDLSGFVDGDRQRRRAIGKQIDRACREVGFFTVVGHGVDDATVGAALRTVARAFFDGPLTIGLVVAMPEPGYPYGYNPLQAEALNRSIGGEAQADTEGDLQRRADRSAAPSARRDVRPRRAGGATR